MGYLSKEERAIKEKFDELAVSLLEPCKCGRIPTLFVNSANTIDSEYLIITGRATSYTYKCKCGDSSSKYSNLYRAIAGWNNEMEGVRND